MLRFLPFLMACLLSTPLPSQDLRQYLATTSELTSAGKYAEALQRVQWFHQNAQSQGPAAMALRLQESLEIWRQLSLLHPPAQLALIEQRDLTSRTLQNTKIRNFDLFMEFRDLAALNRALGQTSHTVEALDWLRLKRADTAAYQPLLWNVARDAVINSKRADLLRLYVPDPEAEFQRLLKQREESLRLIPMTISSLPPSENTSQSLATSAEQVFVGQCLELLEICRALGKDDLADSMRERARALTDDPRLNPVVAPAPRPPSGP